MNFFRTLKNPFRFTGIFKPMVYLFLFSLIYAPPALLLFDQSGFWAVAARCLWVSLFGLGLYFVCTLIWGRRRGTLSASRAAEAFGACLLLSLFTGYCLSPLSLLQENPFLRILGVILGTLFLLFALPSLILLFLALYENVQGWRAQIQWILKAWKEKFWIILNLWLVLFLLMYFWDNLFGGPLYSGMGFDACGIFTSLLFLKEPTVYFEMILMLSRGGEGVYELAVLGLLEAAAAVFLECNIISWMFQTLRTASLFHQP